MSVACGDGDGGGSDRTPKPTATPAAVATLAVGATSTVEASLTPANIGLLDDVIDLAVQLDAMTHDQAVCVFQDHPSIYQEFLQTTGLDRPGTIDEVTLKQQFQDLKTEHAVQLDRCFTNFAG